jgi:uncharacterized iron-regulated membrane protein
VVHAAAPRKPVEDLVASVRDARGAMPSAFTYRSDPAAPASFTFSRDDVLYLNPYTGAALGSGSRSARTFFRAVTDWHRWLAAEGENRATGRAITGASNLLFLFIVISGLYIWLPRTWSRQALRPITWFRQGLSGKARDFNWHNVFGFWCCVPLFFIVLSGVVISYPWAGDLVYRAAGVQPPRGGGKGPGSAKSGGGAKAEAGKRGKTGGRAAAPGPPSAAPPLDLPLEGLSAALLQAERQSPGWKSITMRLPASERAPVVLTIDAGTAGQPQYRGTLTVNRRTGDVERWEPFASYDAGRRLRTWLRFVHTGEYYGVVGQTLAGIASAGAVFLVWTGIALSLRRFASWRSRRWRRGPLSAAEDAEEDPVHVG